MKSSYAKPRMPFIGAHLPQPSRRHSRSLLGYLDARNPASRTAKILAVAKTLSASAVVVVSCAMSHQPLNGRWPSVRKRRAARKECTGRKMPGIPV